MATHVISRRIQLIIQFLMDHQYPSKIKILNFLENKDLKIDSRTFERDLERIRTDFGLEITYSKSEKGYFIDEERSVKVESFFKFLEIVSIADIFSKSLKDNRQILDYVSFDDSKSFRGIENLQDILLAITQERQLLFKHENFEQNTLKSYEITPFLLKEFENRWYVIGVPKGFDEIRTFGIDRLTEINLGDKALYKKHHFEKQLNEFEDIIGINIEHKKPIPIRLKVSELNLKYMRSLPMHQSQIIYPKNESGEYFVDFFLVPNYEFITRILKMGKDAVVISPSNLKAKIKNILEATLQRYNN